MYRNFNDKYLLRKVFLGAYLNLEKNKEMINSLNVFPVPDGDTGTNMTLTMKAAIKDIELDENLDNKEVLSNVSRGSLMGARGNSGVILSQIIRGISKVLLDVDVITIEDIAKALKSGSDMAYKAVMKPVEGTILTVARACGDKAIEIHKDYDNKLEFLEAVVDWGKEILEKTPEMLPILKEAGVVDSGGKGYLIILEGVVKVFKGEILDFKTLENISVSKSTLLKQELLEEDIEHGYCTEFFIFNPKDTLENIRDRISKLGDSVVAVGDLSTIKLHLHTNNPGRALEIAVEYGEVDGIKIDNMRMQVTNKKTTNKKYEIISVSTGEGINKVFEGLNVDYIINGGQTMNPSTEDILSKIEKSNAENIIVLPNNSNIILSANQAKEISQNKEKVFVIPTKSIQEGITSLLSFDGEIDIEENISNMSDAIENVKTGEVTYSVKDTILDGKELKKDDILGIYGKKIYSVGNNIEKITLDLIDNMIDENSEIITLFYGKDVSTEDGEKLLKKVEEKYSNLDKELISGGQPLYYYLISVE